jgi:pimeloyl-ACP methyl ester carboxylesterase
MGYAQNPLDSAINNLVHTPGYKASEYGAIPQYIKTGKGKQTMILIPSWGFGLSVFEDFMEANKERYTMYAITIPGYANTMAPPMPRQGTSYGGQIWNNGVLQGLMALLEKEKIQKAIIAGHSTQGTQLALRMAIDFPDKVSRVIILGGHAKFISIIKGVPTEFPLKSSIAYVDNYTAPKWFKSISKADFDNGNYQSEIYSLDSMLGAKLWKESSDVSLPVMIQYICEFFASDIKTEFDKIKCPVLVLRATFNKRVLDDSNNNYVRPQFMDSWNDASTRNPLIEVVDIQNAATFIWKDNPRDTYKAIASFVKKQKP